jgi:hypothetical protein
MCCSHADASAYAATDASTDTFPEHFQPDSCADPSAGGPPRAKNVLGVDVVTDVSSNATADVATERSSNITPDVSANVSSNASAHVATDVTSNVIADA